MAAPAAACGSGGEPATEESTTTPRTAPATASAPAGSPATRPAGRPWRPGPALLGDLGDVARRGEGGAAIVSVAGGPVAATGPLRAPRAWSTIKVPLLVAFLRWAASERGRASGVAALTAGERADATATITVSDNEAANRLFLALAGGLGGPERAAQAIEATLRRGGDGTTRVLARRPDGARTFTWLGQTVWPLAHGVEVHRALARGRLAGAADTRFVLGLMRRLSRSDWGLRTALPAGVPLAYKVGVGADPDGRITTEQYGIAGRGPRACVIAVAARAGDEQAAKRVATDLASVASRPLEDGRGCAPEKG